MDTAHAEYPLRVPFLTESTVPGAAASALARACFADVRAPAAWAGAMKSTDPAASARIEAAAVALSAFCFMLFLR